MNPEGLFRASYSLYEKALKEMEAGEIKNAAEKAWAATLRAVQGLILARTGEEPIRSDLTTRQLHHLALKDSEIEEKIIGRYHTRLSRLYGDCFYMGICEPIEDIKRRILETDKFIEDAKRLAERR